MIYDKDFDKKVQYCSYNYNLNILNIESTIRLKILIPSKYLFCLNCITAYNSTKQFFLVNYCKMIQLKEIIFKNLYSNHYKVVIPIPLNSKFCFFY